MTTKQQTKRNTTVAAVAALLCAGIGSTAVRSTAAGPTTGRSAATTSLTFTSLLDASSYVHDDIAPAGISPGDRFVFAADLRRHGHHIGRLLATTTAVDSKYQGVFKQFTLLLPHGSLVIEGGGTRKRVPGTIAPSQQRAAVIGGTGNYAGAQGTYIAEDLSDVRQRITITLTR